MIDSSLLTQFLSPIFSGRVIKARSHIHRHRYRHRRPTSFKISVNIYINNSGHTWLTPAAICCPISVEIDPRSIFLSVKNIGGLVGQSDCAILYMRGGEPLAHDMW